MSEAEAVARTGGVAWTWAAALCDPANRLGFGLRALPRAISTVRRDQGFRRRDASLMAIHRGHLRLRVDGADLDPGPGDVVLVPAGALVDRDYAGRRETQDIRFTVSRPDLPPLPAGVRRHDWAAVDLVERLVAAAGGGPADGLRARLLLAQILERLLTAPAGTAGGLQASQRAALEAWTDLHLGQGPTPDDLARAAGAGRDAFARRFRRSYGLTPRQWLARRRAGAAQDMVRQGLSVREAAARLGFADAAHLGRQLRRLD